jgi:Fur family transcriptional regulator, peroxide stress response regulator
LSVFLHIKESLNWYNTYTNKGFYTIITFVVKEISVKNTKQKEIILEAVNELKSHPTADEIYIHLKKDNPRLSLATVYRNLNTYAIEGKIRKVSLLGDSERFDYNLSHHEHFYCESCRKIFDIHFNANEMIKNVGRFNVSSYKLMLFGTCETCTDSRN